MIFRQLFDQDSCTYTYLLADKSSREAVLIDTVFEQSRRDLAMLRELDLKLVQVLDTHCHADHVTAAWILKQKTGCMIAVSENAAVEGADVYLSHGDQIEFGERFLTARATPGHTDGCMTFVLDDQSMAFTGDTLLIRGCGRTDFQQGDPRTMYRSIRQHILSLPEDTKLYPAHDYRGMTVTSVAEEKKYNSRIGGKTAEDDFAGYMHNLGLPHPRLIDIAVPANLKSGKPESGDYPDADPDWAPLSFTFGGIWEVDSHWLADNLDKVTIIDVRDSDEFVGPLGHLTGAVLIPLGELEAKVEQIKNDLPIVTVCRSGSRSAHASNILKKAGFEKVANLHGGMLHWRDQGHQIEGGVSEPDYQI